ncbi:MAG: type IV toxin-antitoxin system AbiEi family antitoxin domain-containing protein [Clostridiales bacterium]|nr:type IV toxin-antitoxin system AbiEi family antitoxin domain-containing protein [Clostridiales bacterium]
MREDTYEKLQLTAEKYNGYIRTADLLNEGFTNRQIAYLTAAEKLQKVSHGCYWLPYRNMHKPSDYKAVEVGLVNPNAIICADSACYYQGLISKEPPILSIATRRSDRHKMDMNFPVNRHYYSENHFEKKYLTVQTTFGSYRIYGIERSVCDCIRFRSDISDDIFYMIIDNYQRTCHDQNARLMAYAKMLRIESKVKNILC